MPCPPYPKSICKSLHQSIPKSLHPELPGPEDNIVDFPEGKIGVYTKFFKFANYRIPVSQFLFNILGHFQIYLSQLSVIGGAKVSHFKINCHVLNIRPTVNLFRVFYIPSYNSGMDERVFPTVVDWHTSAPKDERPAADSYSAVDVATLNLHQMEFFNLINAPNPLKVKIGAHPRLSHEVPLLTATATRLINMENTPATSVSSETPPVIMKSPIDFSNKESLQLLTKGDQTETQVPVAVAPEVPRSENPGQVTGKEKIKVAFEEFKKHEDERVTSRYAEMDARLDALSIDLIEKLYPHVLTAIAGHRWVIGHDLRLAVMKCAKSMELRQVFANVVSAGISKGMSEGLKHGVEHGKAKLNLAAVEAYDPKADDKFTTTFQALKDLEYPLVDQLKRSSYLKIPVYPEVRDPKDPWAFKEEILLEDAITANISHADKKKKSRVVCRTYGVGSAHHARSDGVPVSVPNVARRGLKILLVDTATQTEVFEDEGSPRLLRCKSLPPMFNLGWS
ncbi:hypothetical protein Tco_0939370 [Tanacetum coccineum]|uniref:Transposase (putative) gypsy type domain-containing protein n=1 Tax=Tanacetum coccineum TaxID=301880 RepID=A0ABQ5DKF3_9ASTR